MLSSLTINMDLIVAIVSWTVIHPYMWKIVGWDTFYNVYIQIFIMSVHTIPLISAGLNFAFLMDAPIYISDFWIIIFVSMAYNFVNYYFYHKTGVTYYLFMNWSQPDQYWIIITSIIGLLTLAIGSNTVLGVISQAVVGRFEWQGEWLQA